MAGLFPAITKRIGWNLCTRKEKKVERPSDSLSVAHTDNYLFTCTVQQTAAAQHRITHTAAYPLTQSRSRLRSASFTFPNESLAVIVL